MTQLQVEQAVFSSTERGRIKGYQLIAKSAGIDRELAQELCNWSPSHGSLDDDDINHWTLNFYPVSNGRVAVSRTLLGGPEYSGRGGTQVVTQILVLRDGQFSRYQCSAFAVARTAMALGHLRLVLSPKSPLPQVTLPDEPIVAIPSRSQVTKAIQPGSDVYRICDETLKRLHDNESVACIGMDDPLLVANYVIERLPSDERTAVSFTTGLEPTRGRPFRLHCLPRLDSQSQTFFESQGIHCLTIGALAEFDSLSVPERTERRGINSLPRKITSPVIN